MTQEEIKYHNRLWYYKTYNQLIDKCIQMEKEGYPEDLYTEVHHILPKCQGGTNDECNLVRMPIRYHIIAHMLLACAFPDNPKLIYSVNAILMIGGGNNNISQLESRKLAISKVSTRLISKFREEAVKSRRGKHLTEEHKKKISEAQKGEKSYMYGKHAHHTEETRKKISLANKGRAKSKETREKLSKALKGRIISEETLKKRSESLKGRIISEEHKRKISLANKGRGKGRKTPEDIKKKISMNSGVARKIQGPDGTIYNSISECSRILNIPDSTLGNWVRNKPKKGFKYLDDKK